MAAPAPSAEGVKPDEAYFKFLDEAMAPLLKEGVNKVWEDTPVDPMVRIMCFERAAAAAGGVSSVSSHPDHVHSFCCRSATPPPPLYTLLCACSCCSAIWVIG